MNIKISPLEICILIFLAVIALACCWLEFLEWQTKRRARQLRKLQVKKEIKTK